MQPVRVHPERVRKILDGAHYKILQQMFHSPSANKRSAVPSHNFKLDNIPLTMKRFLLVKNKSSLQRKRHRSFLKIIQPESK